MIRGGGEDEIKEGLEDTLEERGGGGDKNPREGALNICARKSFVSNCRLRLYCVKAARHTFKEEGKMGKPGSWSSPSR